MYMASKPHYFPRLEAEGNSHLQGCNVYCIPQGRVEYYFITYDIITSFQIKDTTVSVAMYDICMPSIRVENWGGISIFITFLIFL